MAVECKNVIVYEHGGSGGGLDILPAAIVGMLIGAVVVDALTTKTVIKL